MAHNWLDRLLTSPTLSAKAQQSSAVEEFASRYIAGQTIESALVEGRRLASYGLDLSFSYLPAPAAKEPVSGWVLTTLLDQLGAAAAGAEISIKPSALGLAESVRFASRQLRELGQVTLAAGARLTLEMQQAAEYEATLELFRSCRDEVADLGLTMVVNLRRTERDLPPLAEQGARVRLCVGSYPTPRGLGYRSEHEKSLAFVRCVRTMMESPGYPMIASHDPRIIAITQELARRNGRQPTDYEFQMLQGVRPWEQRRLVDIGLRCRVYVPFGPGWYAYLATRIAARPRTLANYARAVLDKR